MSDSIALTSDFSRSWRGDRDPLTNEITVEGVIELYQLYVNTVSAAIWICVGVDAQNSNKNLIWKEVGVFPSGTDLIALVNNTQKMVINTLLKSNAFPIFKSVAVVNGNAVIHLTDDGTPAGNALFSNGPNLNTFILQAQNSGAPHFAGIPVLSNLNKTITVPVTKSLAVTVLGISVLAGAVNADGSTVYITIFGN